MSRARSTITLATTLVERSTVIACGYLESSGVHGLRRIASTWKQHVGYEVVPSGRLHRADDLTRTTSSTDLALLLVSTNAVIFWGSVFLTTSGLVSPRILRPFNSGWPKSMLARPSHPSSPPLIYKVALQRNLNVSTPRSSARRRMILPLSTWPPVCPCLRLGTRLTTGGSTTMKHFRSTSSSTMNTSMRMSCIHLLYKLHC